MTPTYNRPTEIATKFGRQTLHGGAIRCTDLRTFADWARFAWPRKTAAHLAAAAGASERTAKYWLAGSEPSAPAVAALFAVIASEIHGGKS